MSYCLNERDIRLGKLQMIERAGDVPYADKFQYNMTLLEATKRPINDSAIIAGRLISKRIMGKILFANIYDIEATIQISISINDAPDAFEAFRTLVDIGDYIGVTGQIYKTKVGEQTIRVFKLEILSKALRPLPEKYHGIADIDAKYRQRYLDIVSNENTRNVFLKRFKIINLIRAYLTSHDFIEVETPILQNIASGANARPFKTRHNALDKDFFLRIAPELYLKQVVMSGFNRVFELGKNFRNEGMDPSHLQEFTMLEWYAAYWDYNDNIRFLVDLIQYILKEVNGSCQVNYQGTLFDFNEFQRLDYTAEVNKICKLDILKLENVAELKSALIMEKTFSEEVLDPLKSITAVVDYVFKKKVRPQLIQPT